MRLVILLHKLIIEIHLQWTGPEQTVKPQPTKAVPRRYGFIVGPGSGTA
jgi:hypothetical protein